MPLPALRQELGLFEAPPAEDGSPAWTLHDPAANRYYRIGWAAFEVLSRWHLGEAARIVAAIQGETALRLEEDDVAAVADFLSRNHLLEPMGREGLARLAAARQAVRHGWLTWLLHHYLFFRVPLFRPGRLLELGAPWVAFAYTPRFRAALAAVTLLGVYLVSRQWDRFAHTFSDYRHWSDLLAVGLALSFAKVLHEFGHAFTAQRYGCRVPTMGMAFLVMWPVLYTDTNEAWKLVSRRQRLAIGAAGILTELALAACATLLWSFMPDGAIRSGLFLLATSTWIITLGINASPFMRFDGYFLLSDWLDMPNLHGRAFALGRWWLRESLFGLGAPVPETFTPRRQVFLIAFAFGTWIYRLVLFLGIAFLVYHLFFKLLGILLLGVELGWFIFLPIWGELREWGRFRSTLAWNRQTRRTAGVAGVLLLLLILPWQAEVRAPAVLGAAEFQGLYAVSAATVQAPPVAAGTLVRAGDVLVELQAPDLRRRLLEARVQEQVLRRQLEQQPFDEQLRNEGAALGQRWQGAAAEAAGLAALVEQLTVRAPFDGRVVEANDSLVPGAWVAAREKLFFVAGTRGAQGEAYVDEGQKARLEKGGRATFVADLAEAGAAECRVADIDALGMLELDLPYVASPYGGQVPARKDSRDALVPLEPVFRVRLDACDAARAPLGELRGVAVLKGERQSFLGAAFRHVAAVLRREAGL